jgi:hypothetical protein
MYTAKGEYEDCPRSLACLGASRRQQWCIGQDSLHCNSNSWPLHFYDMFGRARSMLKNALICMIGRDPWSCAHSLWNT